MQKQGYCGTCGSLTPLPEVSSLSDCEELVFTYTGVCQRCGATVRHVVTLKDE